MDLSHSLGRGCVRLRPHLCGGTMTKMDMHSGRISEIMVALNKAVKDAEDDGISCELETFKTNRSEKIGGWWIWEKRRYWTEKVTYCKLSLKRYVP